MNENLLDFNGYYPTIGDDVFLAKNSVVVGRANIGDDSSIWFNTTIRADVNIINIGKRVNIQDGTTIHVSLDNSVVIENDVTIGHNVVIHASTIKKCSLIGINSTILDGAIIGENSIVGANSLVTQNKKFPNGSLIMGNPAKVVRKLTNSEVHSLKKSYENYVKLKDIYLDI